MTMAMQRTRSMNILTSGLARALLLTAPLALAACGTVDRTATVASVIPEPYEQRHPIVIADAPHSVDLFPSNGRLDSGDRSRVADFARLYKERGRGPISIMLPQDRSSGSAVNAIRASLAEAGVGGHVRVGHYPVQNQGVAAAVRLSFVGLKAKVATQCGEWPDDLASASSLQTWQNKPFWNLGCSYQNMLAAQVADPRDMAGPRGESNPDVMMRMRAIQKVRQGQDPGTTWKVQNSNIGAVGGN